MKNARISIMIERNKSSGPVLILTHFFSFLYRVYSTRCWPEFGFEMDYKSKVKR